MTIDDYDEVIALWTSIPGIGMRSLDDSREGIAKFLDRNPTTCFIAESENKTAGVILSGHDGRRAYIYHAAVSVSEQGNGIGSALIEAVESAMKAEKINRINLVAFAENEMGNTFWEKRGYVTRPDLLYRSKSINEENV